MCCVRHIRCGCVVLYIMIIVHAVVFFIHVLSLSLSPPPHPLSLFLFLYFSLSLPPIILSPSSQSLSSSLSLLFVIYLLMRLNYCLYTIQFNKFSSACPTFSPSLSLSVSLILHPSLLLCCFVPSCQILVFYFYRGTASTCFTKKSCSFCAFFFTIN
jgi:hypothetical protein